MTTFLRNVPQLEILDHVLDASDRPELRVLVIGCSYGMELYSISHRLATRIGKRIEITAVDISPDAIRRCQLGRYEKQEVGLDRIPDSLLHELFAATDQCLTVRERFKKNVGFLVGDIRNRDIRDKVGLSDVVFANNFLIHMNPFEAERCLRSILELLRPGGVIFASGVDLAVRERVMSSYGAIPVDHLIEEAHYGDIFLAHGWPWHYWGLEPFQRNYPQWKMRYATAFFVPDLSS